MPFLSRKSFCRIFPFAIPLAAVLLSYTLLQGDLQILLIFAPLIVVFSICRFDPRIPIGYALLLFVIQAVLTAQNEDVPVKLLAVLSYWLLVVGIVCMIIELFRKKESVQTVVRYQWQDNRKWSILNWTIRIVIISTWLVRIKMIWLRAEWILTPASSLLLFQQKTQEAHYTVA